MEQSQKETFKKILADWRVKRAKLEGEIRSIDVQSKRLEQIIEAADAEDDIQIDPKEFEGMSKRAAAIVYLRRAGAPRTTTQIAEALKKGGMKGTHNFYNTVASMLLKSTDDFKRVKRGTWELKKIDAPELPLP